MTCPLDYYNHGLVGKLKGVKHVLEERGLVFECSTTHNKPGCAPEGGCCSRRALKDEALAHCFFTLSFIASSILSSAIGAEQIGCKRIVGT